jgi:hypothetical protein
MLIGQLISKGSGIVHVLSEHDDVAGRLRIPVTIERSGLLAGWGNHHRMSYARSH